MAGWISSKLKVAESLLQQIDQQAAESLGKNEKPQSPPSSITSRGDGGSGSEIPKNTANSSPSPSLKYQLPTKKKSTPPPPSRSPLPPPPAASNSTAPTTAGRSSPDPAGIDWTELLSSPAPASPIPASSPPMKKTSSVTSKKPLIPMSRKREAVTVSDGSGENNESSSPAEKKQQQQQEEEENQKQGESDKDNDGDEGIARDRNDESSGSSSGSDDDDSETDDDYDSEDERQKAEERRKRREEMIAAKAAAVAAKAIEDKEDAVAKLEGEKQSLEKMLEEREKQQAQEASELQMNMIESMEAAELEKQKHNSTRMEAFALLAKLETTNAELARSLAMVQWDLELEVSRISELRQKIELKELAQQERRRRKLKIHQKRSSSSKEEPLRKEELVQEILEAEYTFVCNKIAQLKDKAKMIEDNIESTRRERVYPTEVEVELRKRLTQLTDHLIQKQTQVESLSSEKATLSLRIEMISRLLDENSSSLQAIDPSKIDARRGSAFDIESGTWQRLSKSEALHERMRSGRQHLGSLLQQLDSIFSAGVVFLRRNRVAQLWASFYLLCLHIWVIYILFSSPSRVSDDTGGHGVAVSLENINKTSAS